MTLPTDTALRADMALPTDNSLRAGASTTSINGNGPTPDGRTRSGLHIDGLTKDLGGRTIVDSFSLKLEPGEMVALLGPSGCGKTTTLRMIAGFLEPDSGRIVIDGNDVTDLGPEKRPSAMVFQNYALWPHMTVFKNVAFPLSLRRLPREEIRRRVTLALETVNLSHHANSRPAHISGGEQQRAALARAIVQEPNLLLLDEPLSNLDAKLRVRVREEIRDIQQRLGITTVIVTHDQEEALVMADRMAILRDGRLLQCGSPEEVYERPADRFVANFIGVMNFIDGTVGADGRFVAPGLSVVAPADGSGGVTPGPATLAVRPENLKVATTGGGSEGTFEGRIEDVAYHGLDRVLHVKTGLSDVPLQARVAIDAAVPHHAGSAVWLTVDPAKCRLFKN